MSQFDKHARLFKKHQQHLESIAAEDWENLIELHKVLEKEGIDGEAFGELQQMLYDLGVIFSFDWMKSYSEELIHKNAINFSSCNLFQLSVYITIIFLPDRFNSFIVKRYFENG